LAPSRSDDGRKVREATMTTPGPASCRLLAGMRDKGCWRCAIEVRARAVRMRRRDAFAGAGFTNLTGDHLDYHKTMEH